MVNYGIKATERQFLVKQRLATSSRCHEFSNFHKVQIKWVAEETSLRCVSVTEQHWTNFRIQSSWVIMMLLNDAACGT